MSIDTTITKQVESWTLDYIGTARKELGKIYEENRDYIDQRLLDGIDFIEDLLCDAAYGLLTEEITEDWKDYKSSGLEQRLTFEEFVWVRNTIAKSRV